MWLIVIDLMNHIESYNNRDLTSIKFISKKPEERYVEFVNKVYKDFIKQYGMKYRGLDLNIPDFLKKEEFDINHDLVGDTEVIELTKQDPTYKEIYRVLLNIFRKKRKRVSANFFTKELMAQLNSQIDKINNLTHGESLYESNFPSFKEFIGEEGSTLYSSVEEYETKAPHRIKSKKANIIVGRFQPIHNGHLKSAEQLKQKNGLPVVFVVVKGDKPNKKSPISKQMIMEVMDKVKAIETKQKVSLASG